MKFPLFISMILMSLLLASCATNYHIISDYEKETDFNQYQTYRVLNHKDGFPIGANPINKQRINRAIKSEMKALGYTENLHPDLIVAWFVKVKDVKYYDVYHGYYGQWNEIPAVNVLEYQEGTLVVDFVDARSRQVIWHGKTTDRVYEDMPNVEKKIDAAINAMFDQFARDVLSKGEYVLK